MFDDDEESTSSKSAASVFNRLYSDHSRVADILDKKRAELAKREVEECTFKPKLEASWPKKM